MARLCQGRGNLVRRAEQLRALGVKTNKSLSAATVVADEKGAAAEAVASIQESNDT
jgi:hypothetical protein